MALQQAEQNVLGCLLQEPGLFHHTLSDGRTLDEAVTPSEFVTPLAARLYERVYHLLGNGASMTLASLLAELASEGENELARLATDAEAAVERVTGQDAERIGQMLRSSADAMLTHHRETEYRQARDTIHEGEAPADADRRAQMLLMEHHKGHPSPVRIARLSS